MLYDIYHITLNKNWGFSKAFVYHLTLQELYVPILIMVYVHEFSKNKMILILKKSNAQYIL